MNKSLGVLIIILFPLSSILFSQSLIDQIDGKSNYHEICSIANNYYEQVRKEGRALAKNDIKEKHFRRWEWYMRNRLGNDGELVNYNLKNQKAFFKYQEEMKSHSRSTLSNWEFIGPSEIPLSPSSNNLIGNGRLDRVALHPTNANIIYVGGPSGGIWKTTDGGDSWESLDDYLPSAGVSAIKISKINPNLIYVVNGQGDGLGNYEKDCTGIYKSLDGGNSWEYKIITTGNNLKAFELAIDPLDDQNIYVATNNGIRVSQDGGDSWDIEQFGFVYNDIQISPSAPYTIYASGTSSVVHSELGSSIWVQSNFVDGTPVAGRKAIGVTGDDPDVVYLFCGPKLNDGTFAGLYKSVDKGLNFSLYTNAPNLCGGAPDDNGGGQSWYNHCIAVSPTDADKIIIGSLVIWGNDENGLFDTLTTYTADVTSIENYVHPDVHDLQFSEINGWLYAATDGGIYKSENGGDDWENITAGIHTTQFFSIASSPQNPTLVVGGSQDNGAKYKNSTSLIWDHYGGGDSYITAFDPNNQNIHYIGSHSNIKKYDSGVEDDITPPGITNTSHSQIETHVSNSDILFVGTRSDTFCISTDQGNSWPTYNMIKSDLCIATCPTHADRLYIAGGWFSSPEINVFSIASNDWTRIDTNGLPDWGSLGVFPTDISVSPSTSSWLVVSISGYANDEKVYWSGDSGASWTNISLNLPNVPVHCVAYLENGVILAGTEIGVFLKASSDDEWIPFNNNLPNTIISEMIVHEDQGLITVCTYGRGAWRTDMPSPNCDENIVMNSSENIQGQKYFEANNSIETNSTTIYGGDGTQVFFQAGNLIDFKDGFRAATNANGTVMAYIGPCGTEIPEFRPEDVSSGN